MSARRFVDDLCDVYELFYPAVTRQTLSCECLQHLQINTWHSDAFEILTSAQRPFEPVLGTCVYVKPNNQSENKINDSVGLKSLRVNTSVDLNKIFTQLKVLLYNDLKSCKCLRIFLIRFKNMWRFDVFIYSAGAKKLFWHFFYSFFLSSRQTSVSRWIAPLLRTRWNFALNSCNDLLHV